MPFIAIPLIPAVGVLLNRSKCDRNGVALYTMLIGYPSTGKTQAQYIIKTNLHNLEINNGTNNEKSIILNTPSIDAIMHTMETNPCVIAFQDNNIIVPTTTVSGRYDQCLLKNLHAATDYVDRSVKNKRRIIQKPRLHLNITLSPFYIINLLKEKEELLSFHSFRDNLASRFLFAAPPAPIVSAEHIRNSPKPLIALNCLFYYIQQVHINIERTYTFTKSAQMLIDTNFDVSRQRVGTISCLDPYIW